MPSRRTRERDNRCFFLNSSESSRVNRLRPAVLADRVADRVARRSAATVSSTPSSHTLSPTAVVAASSPAVTSSESPGRKKPISSPVSAKMIAVRPTYPPLHDDARTSRELMKEIEQRMHDGSAGEEAERRKFGSGPRPVNGHARRDAARRRAGAEPARASGEPVASRRRHVATERLLDIGGGVLVRLFAVGWTWSIVTRATAAARRARRRRRRRRVTARAHEQRRADAAYLTDAALNALSRGELRGASGKLAANIQAGARAASAGLAAARRDARVEQSRAAGRRSRRKARASGSWPLAVGNAIGRSPTST